MFLLSQPRPEPTDESLWLVIQQRGKRVRCFELRANCHRAIAVGSARNADFRVDGAPPVAFFVEREDAAIWVTPAYISDDLRVDTQKLEIRRRLHRSSKVEFASIILELVIRDTPPTLRGNDVPVAADGGAELDDAFREFEANRELTATRELEPWHVAPGVLNPITAEYSRSDLLPAVAFPTRTLEIDRRDLERLFEKGEPEDNPDLRVTRRISPGCDIHDGPAIEPQPTIDVTTPTTPLRLDDPFGELGRTNVYWPPRSLLVLRPEPQRLTMLARLGLLTKRQPLAVLGGALVGTFALSIFLVGAAEIFSRHARPQGSNSHVPVTSHLATTSSPEDRQARPTEPQAAARSSVDHAEVNSLQVPPSVVPGPSRH